MGVLVGYTGFVGGHLARLHEFDTAVRSTTISEIEGADTDILACAGLPAEKWRANQEVSADWSNMAGLAQVLATVRAERAVLISTVDVYQPAVGVDEGDPAHFNGSGAYGAHRAWFEAFFQSHFSSSLVVRLPALFADDVRKNLVHDLLNDKSDQWMKVNPDSTFQFFDTTKIWSIVEKAWDQDLALLNVTSEPVTAQQVADIFDVVLNSKSPPVHYDMRSIHAGSFGGSGGYLFNQESILSGITAVREAGRSK